MFRIAVMAIAVFTLAPASPTPSFAPTAICHSGSLPLGGDGESPKPAPKPKPPEAKSVDAVSAEHTA